MKRLEGRVALVTGAASGIGLATAERLAREGAVAIVTDVQDEAGEEAAGAIGGEGGQAAFLHLDVTDEQGWNTVVERVLADPGLYAGFSVKRTTGFEPATLSLGS